MSYRPELRFHANFHHQIKTKLSRGRENNLRYGAEPQKQEKSDWKSTRLKQSGKTVKSPMVLDLRIFPRIDLEQNHKNKRNRTKNSPTWKGNSENLRWFSIQVFREEVLFENYKENKVINWFGAFHRWKPLEAPDGYDKREARL